MLGISVASAAPLVSPSGPGHLSEIDVGNSPNIGQLANLDDAHAPCVDFVLNSVFCPNTHPPTHPYLEFEWTSTERRHYQSLSDCGTPNDP